MSRTDAHTPAHLVQGRRQRRPCSVLGAGTRQHSIWNTHIGDTMCPCTEVLTKTFRTAESALLFCNTSSLVDRGWSFIPNGKTASYFYICPTHRFED